MVNVCVTDYRSLRHAPLFPPAVDAHINATTQHQHLLLRATSVCVPDCQRANDLIALHIAEAAPSS